RGRQGIVGNSSNALRPSGQLGAWAPNRAAHHVPDDQPINELLARDDFRAQACMDSRPYIPPRISTEIRANAPDHKLLCMGWAIENLGVVPTKTPLTLKTPASPASETNDIVVPFRFSRRFPVGYETFVLHIVQHMLAKLSLFAHGRGELSAHAFNCASKKAA